MALCLRLITVVVGVVLASACVVLEPADGGTQKPEDPILFRGFTSLPGQQVEVQTRTEGGEFETFLTTRSSRRALVLEDGSRIYEWQATGRVPFWQGSGCDRSVEGRALGKLLKHKVPLFTLDAAGSACLEEELGDGTALIAAIAECAESLGGTFTLKAASTTWAGDVTVTTQAEADTLACVSKIQGNLAIRPAESVVHLPALQEVTGDVSIEVHDTTAADFSAVELAQLPELTTIGGSLRFHHLLGHYASALEIGLPALTTLPGDLELVLSSFNGHNHGLDALQTVAGNVTIQASGDFYAFSLLPALSQIQGDLLVQTSAAGSSGNVLNQLVSVGGDVNLISLRSLAQESFSSLTTVGGDLRLESVYSIDPRFGALTTVGGTLALEAENYGGTLPADALIGNAVALSLGALTVRDTSRPTIPLTSATQIVPSGAIAVTDNAVMCQDAVDAFVAALQAEGWLGPLTLSGNAGPCPP
jgi:hypothetical protein